MRDDSELTESTALENDNKNRIKETDIPSIISEEEIDITQIERLKKLVESVFG